MLSLHGIRDTYSSLFLMHGVDYWPRVDDLLQSPPIDGLARITREGVICALWTKTFSLEHEWCKTDSYYVDWIHSGKLNIDAIEQALNHIETELKKRVSMTEIRTPIPELPREWELTLRVLYRIIHGEANQQQQVEENNQLLAVIPQLKNALASDRAMKQSDRTKKLAAFVYCNFLHGRLTKKAWGKIKTYVAVAFCFFLLIKTRG